MNGPLLQSVISPFIMIVTLRPLFSIVLVSKVNFDKFRRMEGVDPGHPCGGDRALLRGLIHGLDG